MADQPSKKKQKWRAESHGTRPPLQAVLLADTFEGEEKFLPITLERPKVLLPLVNKPMIEYTLSWLISQCVGEVFVFCCAHSEQIIAYLDKSGWFSKPNFSVTLIGSPDSISAGDALRLIHKCNVIHGDFVLISGDTVTNMSLIEVLQEHKDRSKNDNSAIMTMVIEESCPSLNTRLGIDELFMAIDSVTKQLVYYEPAPKDQLKYLKANLVDKPSISFDKDMKDCYIDICSPQVLSLFTDNIDYQHLRCHIVKSLLVDDKMGYKIFTHEIELTRADRVDNFRSYAAISKTIIREYPLVREDTLVESLNNRLDRVIMSKFPVLCKGIPVTSESHTVIDPSSVIGKGTIIGDYTKVWNSVIGEGCVIGPNVFIVDCHIWNNVTIEDGCKLKHALICDGVLMKSGAVVNPGVVLSFNVIIGQQFVVPAYSKVSLLQQPIKLDNGKELESAGQNAFTLTTIGSSRDFTSLLPNSRPSHAASEVGPNGAGNTWSVCGGSHEEEWRHSVAPIPASKAAKLEQYDDICGYSHYYEDYDSEVSIDIIHYILDSERARHINFDEEVEAMFLRDVHENVKEDVIISKVNSLSLELNYTENYCACALFYSVVKLALDTPHKSASELYSNVAIVITRWKNLMKYYLHDVYDELEVIRKLEDMCRYVGKKLSPIFSKILHLLHENDILHKEGILLWVYKIEAYANEADKVFFKQSETFIKGL